MTKVNNIYSFHCRIIFDIGFLGCVKSETEILLKNYSFFHLKSGQICQIRLDQVWNKLNELLIY